MILTLNFLMEQSVDIILTDNQPIRSAHSCIRIWVPVTVMPSDADIHIGFSDTPYISLDDSVAAQLSTCTTLPGPWGLATWNTEHDRQCQSGASGRYSYVYTQGEPGYNYLYIWEFKIYGDPAVEKRMQLLSLFNKTVTFMV